MIKYHCSNCGQKFKSDDELSGKNGKCHNCGSPVSIPKTTNQEVPSSQMNDISNQHENSTTNCDSSDLSI